MILNKNIITVIENLVNIPFGLFIKILEYKLKSYGVHLEKVEESYTSKASFIDNDEILVYDENHKSSYTFSGKRISRGLYKSKDKILINADVNGDCNILRKHLGNNVDISYKLLSNVKKINIPKGHKKITSTLSKMFKSEKEVLFG